MQSTKRTVLNGHSPVNQYQVFCLEQSDGGRTLERITLAFRALDELIPKLGVYTKVFHQLRQDLFDAVFSDQLTGSHGDGDTAALVVGKLRSGGDVDDYIQRIPFFSTVSQVLTARDVRADELTDQLDTVKERLFEKHKQFEKSEYRVSELEHQVAELTETVRGLENDVADYKDQLNQLELRRQEEGEKAAHVQKQLEAEVAALQEALEDSRAEIEFLQQYKNGYDNLQEAFSEPTEYDYSRHRSRAVISTKRANLISGIQSAQTLEQQLLAVLNATVEEYDVFLEDHKEDLLEKELTDELTETEMVMQEMEIDTADQQLQQVQIRFKESVDEMTTELSLVRKHITMLQEQLQILEENKPTLQPKESRRASSDRRLPSTPERVQREESVLSAGLGGDEEEDEMLDPFIPQERVFSKYAAMMYTSNNDGKTFHELKEAQFCPSCGEKTVVCPHKLGSGDAVMMLPRGCTHIKVARPNVRINRDLVGALLKPGPQFELAPSTAESKFAPRRGGRRVSRDSLATPMSMDTIDSPILGGTESALIQPMNRLWEDYKRRTHLERTIPRPLSLTRCLSMIEQFCSHLLWQDDFGMEADGFFSINDNLYRFLKERYIDEDVQYLAAHDFLSALVEYQPISKMIQLLCHVLVGNLDASCLRYVLLMNDFIATVHWSEVADFRAFSSVVYPFLNEDDLESLQMSYTSFTENRISPQLVSQFIINVILKYREPRFLDIENRLLALQTRDSGLVGESEFVAMLEHVLPLASDKLRRRLFWETERQARADGVVDQAPLIRVAQMTSYLGLVQISPVVRETVRARVEEWRERPTSSGSVRKSGRETQLVTSQEKLLTSCDLRNLAANVARRARHRDRRLQDEDW